MAAISDSSALILYATINRLDLLRDLFDDIVVPPAVWDEVVVGGAGRVGAMEIATSSWITRQPLPTSALPGPMLPTLDPGEAEVIALAQSYPPTVSVILDDLPARRVAHRLGLTVTGSVGVLLLAKETGLIPKVRPVVDLLRAAGLRVGDSVVAGTLVLAGEADES